MTQNQPQDERSRALEIGLAVLVTVAFVGFFIGTGSRGVDTDPRTPDEVVDQEGLGDLHRAPSYDELRSGSVGPNAFFSSSVAELVPAPTFFPDPAPARLTYVDAPREEWAAAVEEHLANRSFDGAPPTIPHPINMVGAPECTACHGRGVTVNDVVARAPSHSAELTSCTQCHVTSGTAFGGRPAEGALEHAQALGGLNAFGGHQWAEYGDRAWVGAPPTIPHPLHMREQCASCHGVQGRPGLQTTHPERSSCLQCHAPNASLEQTMGRLLR